MNAERICDACALINEWPTRPGARQRLGQAVWRGGALHDPVVALARSGFLMRFQTVDGG